MEKLEIKSKIQDYEVNFCENFTEPFAKETKKSPFVIIDKNVYDLYRNDFTPLLNGKKYLVVEAIEKNKTIEYSFHLFDFLLENGFKRGGKIIAVGGGIIQDLTCFAASVLFRGVGWIFFPTTLLAQCDSCIGSKSSINYKSWKNQVGTFYPPEKIYIDTNFTRTLSENDLYSGMGEAIKVHFLDLDLRYNRIYELYDLAFKDKKVLKELIQSSLTIKKKVIELDEFDRGIRNIMNYGHTFGHAIESVTNYEVPHGMAVAYGMGMANYLSMKLGFLSEQEFNKMEELILLNTEKVKFKLVSLDGLISALQKDKKNVDSDVNFILTKGFGKMFMNKTKMDDGVKSSIAEYLSVKKLISI